MFHLVTPCVVCVYVCVYVHVHILLHVILVVTHKITFKTKHMPETPFAFTPWQHLLIM